VQVDGEHATLTAIAKTSEVMERVLLHRPVAPDPIITELPPKLLAAVEKDPAAPAESPPPPDRLPPPRSTGQKAPGLVALLWISALALLAGLLLLTRPAPRRKRRADLQPTARRRDEDHDRSRRDDENDRPRRDDDHEERRRAAPRSRRGDRSGA
jgi:hypothetical protein